MTENALMLINNVSKKNTMRVGVPHFEIKPNEQWAVIGGNGSGKSTFGAMLAGETEIDSSQRISPLKKIITISFENEQQLLEREIYEDDSEWIDKVDHGRSTCELISENLQEGVDIQPIIETMQLEAFLHNGFRILSTGERRRLMIARALAQNPQMLILDEPYDGLDREFVCHLKGVIAELSQQIPMVIIVNRMSHIGDHITHIACLHQMELVLANTREKIEASKMWQQLQQMQHTKRPMPKALSGTDPMVIIPEIPFIEMRSIKVGYHDKVIIHDLDWKVMPGEHWKISGPNGSGKSTLMNLISGDHPQCFSNEVYIFGQRRGQGESIWDIKRRMGLMSTALHQQHRVNVSCEAILLSGFHDSIGVYASVTSAQREVAAEWLEYLGLEKQTTTQFKTLSFGQQRMLLIARALIKRPPLLLLDEPCQGLDPVNRALVIELISQITERKIAQIIYISHDTEDHIESLTHELKFTAHEQPVDVALSPAT